MRITIKLALATSCILAFSAFCFQRTIQDKYPLNGEWKPIRQEMGGRAMPPEYYAKHLLVLQDTNYVFTAESVDIGVSKYADGKMDITGKEGVNTGRSFKALYELKKDTLSICYNLKGDQYPASLSTQGQPMYFLSVYIRNNKE